MLVLYARLHLDSSLNIMHIPAEQISHQAANKHADNSQNLYFYAQLAVLLLLSILLEAIRAAQLQGFARAESCFVEGAREMFANKQYVMPLLYNVPYFDKPPFFYWLIIGFYKLFGISLLNARLVSVAAATLTIAITAIFVKQVIGKKTALLSAVILTTTIGFCEFAAIAMPDMLLCLFTNLATFCAYMAIFKDTLEHKLYLLLMTFAFALGWMTKGPVAIVVPAIAILVSLLAFRQKPNLTIKDLLLCLVVFLAVLIPWHIAVCKSYGVVAFNWLYLQGNIDRFIGKHSSYNFGHNPTYILINLLGNFLPWTIFTIPALGYLTVSALIPKTFTSANKFLLLMMFWSLSSTLFFSLSHSNWGYYSLSIYPALSIITAYFLISLESRFSSQKLAALYLTIAGGFFIGILIYTFAFLPAKTKNNTFLNFAAPIKNLPPQTPLYFHTDLYGQYLLIDYMIFQSKHIPVWCDQSKFSQIASSSNSFVTLMPKVDFDELSASDKSHFTLLENENISWITFPGCKLISKAQPGQPIELVLLQHTLKP